MAGELSDFIQTKEYADASPDQRKAMIQYLGNLSPEDRQARIEGMTPLTPPKHYTTGQRLAAGAIDTAATGLGAVGGGMVGSFGGPVGTVVGGAGGAMAAHHGANMLNNALGLEDREEPLVGPITKGDIVAGGTELGAGVLKGLGVLGMQALTKDSATSIDRMLEMFPNLAKTKAGTSIDAAKKYLAKDVEAYGKKLEGLHISDTQRSELMAQYNTEAVNRFRSIFSPDEGYRALSPYEKQSMKTTSMMAPTTSELLNSSPVGRAIVGGVQSMSPAMSPPQMGIAGALASQANRYQPVQPPAPEQAQPTPQEPTEPDMTSADQRRNYLSNIK